MCHKVLTEITITDKLIKRNFHTQSYTMEKTWIWTNRFKKCMTDTVTTIWSYGEYSEPGFVPKGPLYETVCPKKAIMANCITAIFCGVALTFLVHTIEGKSTLQWILSVAEGSVM